MTSDNGDAIKKPGEAVSKPSETFTASKRAKAKADIIEALERAGGHIGKACQAAGIHRATFYTWISKDEEFKVSAMAVIEHKVDNVEFALYSSAIKGNVVAQIFYLKNKRSDKWKDHHHLNATVATVNLEHASAEIREVIKEFGLLGSDGKKELPDSP